MDERPDIAAPDAMTESAAPTEGVPPTENESLQREVIEMLSTIYDPEIPVNIFELGLVYEVNVTKDGDVEIIMTLTTPNCPVAESMPGEVEYRVGSVPGVRSVAVEIVWEPQWTPERMSEAAKLELGFL